MRAGTIIGICAVLFVATLCIGCTSLPHKAVPGEQEDGYVPGDHPSSMGSGWIGGKDELYTAITDYATEAQPLMDEITAMTKSLSGNKVPQDLINKIRDLGDIDQIYRDRIEGITVGMELTDLKEAMYQALLYHGYAMDHKMKAAEAFNKGYYTTANDELEASNADIETSDQYSHKMTTELQRLKRDKIL